MSDFDVLGIRRKACAAYFCKVPDSRESELGFVRYGPANRGHRGVFGPLGDIFPIGIPARPGKILAIREFHVVHGCVFFPTHRARGSTCCESGRLCAQARQRRWENSGNFSTTLFRRPVFMRVVDVAPDIGFRRSWYRRKACATYFSTVQALHRGELGFARYDLANRGRRNVPYAKGVESKLSSRSSEWSRSDQFDSAFGLVHGPVKPWSNLVNLGQTWSNLVKALQTLGNVSRTAFRGFLGIAGPSRVRNGLVKPWSNSVNPGQTLVKLREMCPGSSSWGHLMWRAFVGSGRLGSGCLVLRAYTRENPVGTAKNLPQFTCHSLSDTLALNRLTHGSKVKVGFRFLVFSLNSTFPTSAFSFPSSSDLALRKFVRLSEMSDRCGGSRDRRRSSRLGFLCHASSIEVVVALSAGSECTRIPYFRLNYLVEFLIPGLRYRHRFGRFCKRCPFAWMM
uniref:Uncharacterized protein n=1 Tax=Fagus sylvatica TaxID=28930 RepID=A0A2N9HY42_FAGSY